jgi:methyl-accepting chemotaxis protein
MSFLTNAKIGMKTIVLFSLIIVLVAGMGMFAISQMSAINRDSAEVRDNWLPSVGVLGRLASSFERYRAVEGTHIQCETKEQMAEEEKSLAQITADIAKYRKAYAPLLTPGFETDTYKAFSDAFDTYLKISETKVLSLSREHKQDEALTVFRSESRTKVREARALLAKLVDFNQEHGDAAADLGEEVYRTSVWMILSAIGVTLFVCLGIAWSFQRLIARPIGRLTGVMGQLAGNDLSVAVPDTERGDEVGAMARTVQIFKTGLETAARLTAEQASEREREKRRTQAIDRMVREFDEAAIGALKTVSSAASELDATAHSMSSMAQQTNAQASAVAAAAEQTSANVQTVATATEEMSSSIQEISNQVHRSSQIAGRAVAEADRTNTTVLGLSEAAQKVGDVVQLITSIASQTNLLALNATIEAARAGEAGKGFAVVASEVKNLANQTAKATEDIAAQINAIQSATGGAVQAIGGIGGIIREMSDIATGIAAAIEEQSAATGEIARNVQQAAKGTEEVSSNIVLVTQTANETGSASTQVLGAAGELARQAESLRHRVEEFLSSIKAA